MNPKFFSVVSNVIKVPKLRFVLIVCLATTVLLPSYYTYHALPMFLDQLILNTERGPIAQQCT